MKANLHHTYGLRGPQIFFSPLACSSAGKKFLLSATSDFPVSVHGPGSLGGIKLCSPTDRQMALSHFLSV